MVFLIPHTVHTNERCQQCSDVLSPELFVDEDGAFLHFGCLCFTAFVAQVMSRFADFFLSDVWRFDPVSVDDAGVKPLFVYVTHHHRFFSEDQHEKC